VPEPRRKKVTASALELLCEHSWPGNVRELANTVERAILLAEGDRIGPGDLFPTPPPEAEVGQLVETTPPTLAEVERRHILQVLETTGGKKAPAARLLGVNVKTLSRKLKSYRLPG
jgi:DNA-binding NtrC family response regulator